MHSRRSIEEWKNPRATSLESFVQTEWGFKNSFDFCFLRNKQTKPLPNPETTPQNKYTWRHTGKLLKLLNSSIFSWATEQFYLFLSQLNFFSQRTSELHPSQQLTFTAARVKLGQLGKEKISQYRCQRKRKRLRDTVSVKGGPVKRPEHWVHLQSKQRELHSAGTEAARAFHQLSCVTAMARTSNTHRDS